MIKNKITFILLHKDSFILVFAVFLLWLTISLITDEYYDFSRLTKYTGLYEKSSIVITKIINKPLYKDTTRELRLWLRGEALPFNISRYQDLDKVLGGFYTIDTLSVYTKNKTFYIFGSGGPRQIVHMRNERTKENIIDFRKAQTSAGNVKYLTGIFTVAFIIWYTVRVSQRLYWES